MQKVNVKEARRNISRLLDEINAGEEIIILRRGKPVARMLRIETQEEKPLQFPDRSLFRSKLPPMKQSSASLIRDIRDERG
ncbi:MAG: type II toxin-antitoxin system prevent-host-death family antitoxin [Desulfobacteraceae bacterium]|nr:type II toxin-antitoxin system prevent-host-death family antitoxin [Desulfobacteraceae bacterium]